MHNKYSMMGDVTMGKYIDIRCYKQVRFIIKNCMKKEKLYKARGSWQGIYGKIKLEYSNIKFCSWRIIPGIPQIYIWDK